MLLNKSSHSGASRSSRVSVTAVPGFIQKSCSPQRSCGSLGTCMQMSRVVALILSSPRRADILPGTETAHCCVRMLSGRAERGGRGGAQGADPVVVAQQIKWTPPANHSVDTSALVTTPPSPPPQHTTVSIRYPSGGPWAGMRVG